MVNFKFLGIAVTAMAFGFTFLSAGDGATATHSAGVGRSLEFSRQETPAAQNRLLERIRRTLITLPYYDVFDWLEGTLQPDGTLVLRGQVVRATTRSGAESRVKDLEGIERVVNQIEVLPPSPGDDRLRRRLYLAIYGQNSPLFRYAVRAVPPIHIIVNRGRVTLRGVVATEGERTIAYSRARTVPGTFGVTNELVVERADGR